MTVRIQFFGSGNAFADGGRSHACIYVSAPDVSLLLDCGGSSLPVIRRSIDPGLISGIAVTHLHGDHFGGIPFFVDQQKYAFRKAPLVVGGPPSLAKRMEHLQNAYTMDFGALGFPLSYLVLDATERDLGGARVSALPVRHSPSAEPHGLRIRIGDTLIAYSGDASWSDELVAVAKGADLFICEATNYATAEEKTNPVHVSYETLMRERQRLECRRMVLTHLGSSTLSHAADLALEYATDGMELDL